MKVKVQGKIDRGRPKQRRTESIRADLREKDEVEAVLVETYTPHKREKKTECKKNNLHTL